MKMNKYNNDKAYRIIAPFYDTLMGNRKYQRWKELMNDVIFKYGITPGTCLDIACGTGNFSLRMKELGFHLIGVDKSRPMIKEARKKLAGEKFIQSDIRRFNIPASYQSKINLVVCFFDSLNYLLTDKDLLMALQSVYRNVPSGTIFVFDMNPMDHVRVAQTFRPRVNEEKNFYSIFRFGGRGRFWTINMDFFINKGNYYHHLSETHVEKGYDMKDVLSLLKKTKFGILEIRKEYKIYEDNKEHLSRLYFIVKK